MFQTFKNAWRIPELRKKILFTFLIIVLYRIGSNIPVPYVNGEAINGWFTSTAGSSILTYFNILSGSALSYGTLFALSVSPYITASIVVQLLCVAIPALERWSKDEAGRKKVNVLTRIITVVLAIVTALGYALLLRNNSSADNMLLVNGAKTTAWQIIVMVACYCAGAAIVMWLGEKVNEHGIGNGISIILFAGIVSRGPALIGGLWSMITSDKYHIAVGILLGVLSVAITLALIVLIVWVTNSERRIPIQYAKRTVGRKMYGGQSSNLPLKLNMAGVMPIIFANSIVAIPATIASLMSKENWFTRFVDNWFDTDTWIYIVINVILIIAFSYFYIMISFNPVEVANNIKDNGGAVPGIRPGKPTSDYIQKVLNRVTLIGAAFLTIVAALPLIINAVSGGQFAGIAFGGTSILIVVGVALETVRELESQITMRNYKGFLD
ncbi:MAG: preprotein translocase subunit SecY [Clostridia bacterium]|nr:preprotein translocase subunit SecY [Clostridia bacterium]